MHMHVHVPYPDPYPYAVYACVLSRCDVCGVCPSPAERYTGVRACEFMVRD